ncbi:MAG: ribosome biogenesis GTP-binding protein YihA/YsxC [Candidatus Paceibacterota bacterium]|jgi:GTP-binding protein|nr:ribosome biogenesis GTP-binding protein YihA/YsxC [bacterium]
MKVESAKFIKGVTGTDSIFEDGIPQFAFIGRSNVGKSSVINSLVGQGGLARTSSFPGFTRQINLFLINHSFYLVDLPGYGYAKLPFVMRDKIKGMVNWYFFNSKIEQKKILLIIDAYVGLTKDDLLILRSLEEHGKNVVIVANKVDKIRKTEYEEKMNKIIDIAWPHKIIPYSAEKNLGRDDLFQEFLS